MIGEKAMAFMLFSLLGLVLLIALLVSAVHRSRRLSSVKRAGAIFISVVAGSYLILNISFHFLDYSRLRSFRPEDLVEIRVADHVVTSVQDIRVICASLKATEWFDSSHGGWGEELPLIFKTTTGREYTYRVAYYRVHPGAVIASQDWLGSSVHPRGCWL